jgi:exonuclease SbcC
LVSKQLNELQQIKFDEDQIKLFEQKISIDKLEKEKLTQTNLEINSKINSFLMKSEENKKIEKKISSLDICPTCLQNVDSVYKANVLNELHSNDAESAKKIEILEVEKKEVSEKIRTLDSEIFSMERQLTDLKILKMKLQAITEKQTQIENIKKSNFLLEKDIEILKQHLNLLSDSILELSKFSNILEIKQKELEEALRQERLADIKVAELKKEIEVFSRQIEELKKEIEKSEKIKLQLGYLTELENWLSKQFTSLISFIEKNVMIKLKTEFSKLFAEWFYTLVSDNFNVRLSDDFTPIIEQQDYEIEYAYLSGGERTAIALAYRLSLNQVINSLLSKIKTKDLVILDEPTDGFSEQQLDKMRDVLQQLNIKQLIIVSHEQKIEGFVENVIKFKKENGITSVEVNKE